MYKHILIATDGSELSTQALHHGLSLAKIVGAKATVANVSEPWTAVATGEMAIAYPVEEYNKSVERNAETIFANVAEFSKSSGIVCETLHVKDQFPAEGIIATAQEKGCDLIVMASHGRRGLSRFFLGSQAARVVTQSKVPVLVYK